MLVTARFLLADYLSTSSGYLHFTTLLMVTLTVEGILMVILIVEGIVMVILTVEGMTMLIKRRKRNMDTLMNMHTSMLMTSPQLTDMHIIVPTT